MHVLICGGPGWTTTQVYPARFPVGMDQSIACLVVPRMPFPTLQRGGQGGGGCALGTAISAEITALPSRKSLPAEVPKQASFFFKVAVFLRKSSKTSCVFGIM